jgi:hypothetical protein
MKCIHCHKANIAIKPTLTGIEIGCPGCGRVYSAAEIKELVRQIRLAGKDKPKLFPPP